VQRPEIKKFLKGLVLVSMLATAACETTPPAQEMSDARQAIEVAREAGAAEHAAFHLKAAEDYLESAKQALNSGDYAEARRNAKHAKMKALDALREAEASADQN
jgi:HEPN domain-containing protein